MSRAIDWTFEALGLTVALSPALVVIAADVGNPVAIPRDVAYRYTGFNIDNGSHNISQTKTGILTLVVGGAIAGVPRIYRMVRKLVRGR